jgi:hypothetical protein
MAKILFKQGGIQSGESSFPSAFRDMLDGDGHGIGLLEQAQKTTRKNSEAIGKLVEILYEEHLLGTRDIHDLLDLKYSSTEIEIIKD